jgi:hypothetical protein
MEYEKNDMTGLNSFDRAQIVDAYVNDGGVMKQCDHHKAIYNISQGRVAAFVSNDYKLINHGEYFESFKESLDRLNLDYTYKTTNLGNMAIVDFSFKNMNIKFEKLGEEFATGIRLVNSYNKSTGLMMFSKFTRLACMNGMVMSKFAQALNMKHTSKEILNFAPAIERKLAHLINERAELQAWVEASISDSIEWEAVGTIMTKLMTQQKHRAEILSRLNIQCIKKDDGTFEYASENKAKRTRWEIYNAITHYLTHSEQLTPFISEVLAKKAEKVLINPLTVLV